MLLLSLMLGCPEPPSGNTTGADGTPGGAPGAATPPPGGGADAGPPAGGGAPPSFNGELAQTQEELADGVTVSGTLTCDGGEGPFRILLFPPPPSDGSAPSDEPPQPFTGITSEPGDWSMKGPQGESVVVMGFDDADGDGSPLGAIFFAEKGKDISLDADVEGLALDCSDTISGPPPGAGDAPPVEGGELPAGEGAMGPPPEGGEMGPPPEGGEMGPPPEGGEMGPSGEPPAGGELGPPGEPPEGAPAGEGELSPPPAE